jgi:hypothetical protein
MNNNIFRKTMFKARRRALTKPAAFAVRKQTL